MARLPFVDWMKAIGMFLIVFGHVVGGTVNLVTPPIYHKQWGVAFFLFVTAFTLARETRPVGRVVFNRLFEILLVGGVFAVLSTVLSLALGGRGHLSNYWPFLLGANVLVDAFPANPTTWYIGTYIHVILLWALFGRRLRPTLPLIGLVACAEIAIRALLWTHAGGFVAYMVVPNWLTCLLLGTYAGQRDSHPAGTRDVATAAAALALPLVIGLVTPFDGEFPFRGLPAAGMASRAAAAAGVTLLYAGGTWLAFRLTTQLRRSAAIEFLARHTVFIFVSHMPVYYWLMPAMGAWPRPARAIPLVLICYVGLAVAGAIADRVLQPVTLRNALLRRYAHPA